MSYNITVSIININISAGQNIIIKKAIVREALSDKMARALSYVYTISLATLSITLNTVDSEFRYTFAMRAARLQK